VAPHQIIIETPEGGLETIRDCPIRLLRGSGITGVFELFYHYPQHLPFPGAVNSQPRWLMKAFEFIGRELKLMPPDTDKKKKDSMKDAAARAHALVAKLGNDGSK